MFSYYTSKPVQVQAMTINELPTEDVGVRGVYWHKLVSFMAHQEPKVGDFIIKLSDTDVYHCPRSVFLAKYEPIQYL